jgi:ribosome-associated protein
MDEPAQQSLSLGERPINLTQVLKAVGCARSGGEAKLLISEGQIRVNGEVELRKRRQMKLGDIVAVQGGPTIALVRGDDVSK